MLRTAFYTSPSIEIAPRPIQRRKISRNCHAFFFLEILSPPLLLSHDNSTRWQLHHAVLRSHAVIPSDNSSAGADSFFLWGPRGAGERGQGRETLTEQANKVLFVSGGVLACSVLFVRAINFNYEANNKSTTSMPVPLMDKKYTPQYQKWMARASSVRFSCFRRGDRHRVKTRHTAAGMTRV